MQDIIQSFEFSFELAWKTLKDYLESQGILASFPREVLKLAFQHGILDQGTIWLEMLEQRNLLAHTYNEALAQKAHHLIRNTYGGELEKLQHYFENLLREEQDGSTP